MDTSDFTDLLSAAMSESGLMDLETSETPAAGSDRQPVSRLPPVVVIPASDDVIPIAVQSPRLQTSRVVVQHPQLQNPALSAIRSPVMPNYPDAQPKGLRKIVVRTFPAALQPLPGGPAPPSVALRPASDNRKLFPTSVTLAGSTSAVRSGLPIVRATVPQAGVATIVQPKITSTISPASLSSPGVRQRLSTSPLRFTTIPRPIISRLPEANVSLQIRPRLTLTPAASRPMLLQNVVPSTISNLSLPSSSNIPDTVTVSVTQSTLSVTAATSVAETAVSVVLLPVTDVMRSSLAKNTGSTVPQLDISPRGEFSLTSSTLSLKDMPADTAISVLSDNRKEHTSATASASDTVTADSLNPLPSSTYPSGAVTGMLTVSEDLITTSASSEVVEAKADNVTTESIPNGGATAASEVDEQQVGYVHNILKYIYAYATQVLF